MGLTFLNQSQPHMFRPIINAHADFILILGFNNLIQLDGHRIFADKNGLMLPDQPPCVLPNGWIQTFAIRIKHE